jgi:hypothetical protein
VPKRSPLQRTEDADRPPGSWGASALHDGRDARAFATESQADSLQLDIHYSTLYSTMRTWHHGSKTAS